MGGKSKSSQKSSTVNNVDNRIFDIGEGSGPANFIEGSNNTVSTTDHEAVKESFNFGRESLSEAVALGTQAINMADDSQARTLNAIYDNNTKTFSVITDTIAEAFGFGRDSLLFADERTRESNQLVESTMQQHINTGQKQVGAITDLAKSFNTGGQTDIAKNMQNTVLAVAAGAVVIVGIVAFTKAGK